jgi:hypothetical protein
VTESTEPEPLWREVVGDTEPWRRGRVILILLAVVMALNQALLFGVMVLNGALEVVLTFGIGAALFWLCFYLIWIGIHWVRWVTAFCWGAWGLALLVWSLRDSSEMEMFSGTLAVVVAVCLGFVPSVYFFAQRQRETRRVFEMVEVGAVVVILILSLTMTMFALSAYKLQLQGAALSFADQTFQRIFTQHDTYFLLENASDDLLKKEGRLRMTRFLQYTTMQAGDVHNIHPAEGWLWFSYAFPATLVAHAEIRSQGEGTKGPLELRMRTEQLANEWRIHDIQWFDPRLLRRAGHKDGR